MEEEEEEEEEEATNVFNFNDSERLPYNHNHPSSSSSSSSHNLSPIQFAPSHHHHHHHHNHISVFPPINHEGLPIPPPPPPPHAPLSLLNSDDSDSPSPPSSSSSPPRNSHFSKWFDYALHLWNSKLLSLLNSFRSRGFFSSLCPVAATASFLLLFWLWVRRLRWRVRLRQRSGGEEGVEHLKLLIKEKDEIIKLLEQIADMNRVLLARYKIPVLRAS